MLKYFAPSLILICFLIPASIGAAPPTGAVKFVILQPTNSTVGTPVTVTIEAQKSNNQADTDYQNDVTLVTSGSATGGGVVDIINGVGTKEINDSVAETVTLSLSDTESTGLDVSSTKDVVFASLGSGQWRQSDFWFRDDDGSEITATGWGDENTAANLHLNLKARVLIGRFRLRMGIRVQTANDAISPQLEYKLAEEGDICSTSGGWQKVSSSGKFVLSSSSNFSDSDPTTQQITAGAGFIQGLILSSTNPASSLSLLKNEKTEYEWVLDYRNTGDVEWQKRYIFRVTNADSPLDVYQNCPFINFPPEPKSSVQPTIVSFSGQAFPGGSVSIVDKDIRYEKVLSQEKIASEDGTFRADFVGVLQGQHGFGLVIKDSDGRKTQTKFFNIDTISNSLTVKEILVPPTLDFAHSAIARGEPVTILGHASPGHRVWVEVDGKIKKEAESDEDGLYKIEIPTGELEFGPHEVLAKQIDSQNKKESDNSLRRVFTVSRLQQIKADFNGDNTVDIRDWSIFLARWSSKDNALRQQIDFNSDGKIDISDFGIFIRNIKRR